MRRGPVRRRPADNHLSTVEWREVFHRLLERSGGLCEGRTPACLAPGGSIVGMVRERVSIQHRRARGMGGTDVEDGDLANLLVLCGSGTSGCHGWVETGERERALELGLWIRHDYRDRAPVPAREYPVVIGGRRRVLLDPVVPVYLPHPDPYGLIEPW